MRVLDAPFRLPVQWVNRPNLDFRGFTGQIASGTVAVGDKVRALPSGKEAIVARIVTQDGDLPQARGRSVHHADPGSGNRHVAWRPAHLPAASPARWPTSSSHR